MPLYEYQCDGCGTRFERIQKFSDPPIETCPSCGGAVRKLLSSPAIQFKGSGWYITDYAKKSSSRGGDKAAGGDSASGDAASSAKPASGGAGTTSGGGSSSGSGSTGGSGSGSGSGSTS